MRVPADDAAARDVIPEKRQLSDRLHKMANDIYQHNDEFRRKITPSNRGRDQLYVWMRHWLSSELHRSHPAIYRKLPVSFRMGREMPKGRWGGRLELF